MTPLWMAMAGLMRTAHFQGIVITAAVFLGGCASEPSRHQVTQPEPATRVIAYPARGQGAAQLDRDRYECHLWAVRESRFDPSAAGVPEAYRVRVEPAPGSATVAGVLAGAVLGAVVGSPHDAGAGAVVGAVAGGALGAAADQDRAANEWRADRRAARYQTRATAYRRAVTACLEGRGYTVK
ncbi:MAG: glycine zipper family protein [Gammaproteobacteria bacterium]|nr:glycine zipper family protein [Gammaproteobacteria bacterium]